MGATYDDAKIVIDLLERCKLMDLSDNPWKYPPADVVSTGLEGIIVYYLERAHCTEEM